MAIDLTISDKRLNELKQKVKNEMKRRSATEHTNGSLSEYANSDWDYSNVLESSSPILDEHIQKIIDPLLEVNDFLYDNSLRKNKSGMDMPIVKAEQFVDSLSSIANNSSNSGCRGNCTGLCSDACFGSCSGGCRNGCSHTCGSGCTTGAKR